MTNNGKRFQSIPEACRTTGLSMYFLRMGCRAGTIPHIMCGKVYKIDMEELFKQLTAESTGT